MANAKATTTRKSNVAMVYNPARKLTVGGASRTANPVKKRKKTTRRSNPAPKKVVNASSHRRRRPRRSNPSTILGLLAAALVAGVGVSLFDILTTRFLPMSGGAMMRMGVKAGGAYLFQSNLGNRIPILGKYKNEIALVLLVSAVVDGFQMWISPVLNQVTGGYLLPSAPRKIALIPANDEMGEDYYVVEEYEGDDDDGEGYEEEYDY